MVPMSLRLRALRTGTDRVRSPLAFTLTELAVVASILVIISAASFPALVTGFEQQKLRQAAVEVQSWLQRARSLAQRGYGTCAVTGTATGITAGTLTRDTANTTSTACSSGNLPNLNLPALSTIRGFCLSTNGGTGATTCTALGSDGNSLVFTDLGVLAGSSRTLYLAGTAANNVQYCVEASLTLIRVGFRNSNSGACRFDRT
ncbi:MAG: Tfp pilus assembly protein FimT/FimU [Cyanobium sp.]